MSTRYDVISIADTTGLNDAGQLAEMKVVTYRSQYGDVGKVSIEKTMYTADAVKALIDAEIAENDILRGVK